MMAVSPDMQRFRYFFYTVLPCLAFFLAGSSAHAAATSTDVVRDIAFPTDATLDISDNFGDPRSGHTHEAIDIMGEKMLPLYAAVDGYVSYLVIPEASWGYAIELRDSDGYTYHYLHVNNDTPGTDDRKGGTEHAYAPGIARGTRVTRGQLIGWMGDSGNAEKVGAHLHFEIRMPDETAINPYLSLVAAKNKGSFDKDVAMAASPDINTDKGLKVDSINTHCTSGSLIKSASSTAVYYCGADGKRYVFPNDRVYFSWYKDFKTVVTVKNDILASISLGGLVTYKPGVKMVKIESLPNVYAVEKGGTLRWIKTPEIAASIYGSKWNKNVDDVSDAFFGSYKVGEDVTGVRK